MKGVVELEREEVVLTGRFCGIVRLPVSSVREPRADETAPRTHRSCCTSGGVASGPSSLELLLDLFSRLQSGEGALQSRPTAHLGSRRSLPSLAVKLSTTSKRSVEHFLLLPYPLTSEVQIDIHIHLSSDHLLELATLGARVVGQRSVRCGGGRRSCTLTV